MRYRAIIVRTEGEWKAIEQRINKSDLNSYLRCELSKLNTKYKECPGCVTHADGELKRKEYLIAADVYQTLELLSIQMKRPISTIIDNLLINPLLLPD